MSVVKNTRQNTRHDAQLPIEFAQGDAWISTTMRNLSLGGAFIEHTSQPAFGTRLVLRFHVANQAIEVGAIVRWTDSDGFGVQFDGLRAKDVWALGKHFEQA